MIAISDIMILERQLITINIGHWADNTICENWYI